MTHLIRPNYLRNACTRFIVLLAFVLQSHHASAHLAQNEHFGPAASSLASGDEHGHDHGRKSDHAPHSALDHAPGPIAARSSTSPTSVNLLALVLAAGSATATDEVWSAIDHPDSRPFGPRLLTAQPRGPPASVLT